MPATSAPQLLPYLERLLDGETVEWKTLGEVCNYEQPTAYLVRSTDYSDRHPIPVLTAGKTFILGYTNETTGVYRASQHPTIIFDDFTTANKWVDFDFKAKSSAMKMLTSKDEKVCLLKYIYYWLNTLPADSIVGDHNRQWISNYAQKLFPLPPLRVQARIVEILDKFTQLEAELEAELEARNKQYDFYRNRLLTGPLPHSPNIPHQWEQVSLGSIGEVRMCKRILKQDTTETGEIPFYKIGTFGKSADAFISRTLFEEYKQKYAYPRIGDILISASGTIGRAIEFDGQDAYFQDSNIVWLEHDDSKVLNRFLYYCYQIADWKVSKGGTIARLYNDNIKKTLIPLPPLSEQRRIVVILDRFDTLTHSISEGLPREIALRRKQYEYYRDALLRFPQPAPTA